MAAVMVASRTVAIHRFACAARLSVCKSVQWELPRYAFASAPGLLSQLPDFSTGAGALEEGRYADALLPLQRASQVAAQYFPATALTELAMCHSATGHCLWNLGRYTEAAAQFDAGLDAARSGGAAHAAACASLAEAAARVHFEIADFEAAGLRVAEASKAQPTAAGPRLIAQALAAVDGHITTETEPLDGDLEVLRTVNALVGKSLPNGGSYGPYSSATDTIRELLNAEFADEGFLRRLLPPAEADTSDAHALEPATLSLMAARSTVGQLAVAAGLRATVPWVRPVLVTALNDFEALKPSEPTLWPILFRTLGSLGPVLSHQGDFMTAEGLLRSAVDHVDDALSGGPLTLALSTGRGRLWQAQLFTGFADVLENGRRAEQRASEISQWRERAAAIQADVAVSGDARRLRWSLLFLPPPAVFNVEESGSH